MSDESEVKGKVDPIDEYVGKRLKMRRIMLGLSQHDLGNAVNVSIQQIQKYEKATNRISSGRLYAFSKLLMAPIDFFFKDIANTFANEAFQDDNEPYDISTNIAEKELLSLIRSFREIKDISVRKKIVDLVRTISDTKTI